VCACAATPALPDGFAYREIEAGDFTLASYTKLTDPAAPVHVYIEGDGAAFRHGFPTRDPTPKSTLVRNMAFADKAPNVAYLARPCQYVMTTKCEEKYWTSARFSAQVIEAEYRAVKTLASGRKVVLIGFSGGAQIAGLLAATTDLKVERVITIAGNLDHRAWTNWHRTAPLEGSLNLADYREKFARIPQTHYVGAKDKVVPPHLAKDFGADVIIIENAAHESGWDAKIAI
jgi:pimeloyl-ACP methyl ester carboxylesterase